MTTKTSLKGKNAIVTGAAVGLGNAYAAALAGEGVNIAVIDIREDVAKVPSQLARHGVKVLAFHGDVANPADVRRVVDTTQSVFGSIDILINNAGIWGASGAEDDLDKSLADYEKIVGTNMKGEYLFGRAVIPIMIAQGKGGEIVNVATDHHVTCGTPHNVCPNLATCPWNKPNPGFQGPPRPTGGGEMMDLYDAGKWGLNGFLFAWAKALRPHNIRVNGFCMGATDSYMLRSFHNFNPSKEEEASWMRAEDNAQALIDLLKEGPQGRTAENMNFCVGRPVKLEPPRSLKYILPESVATTGA
ncbi:MAG: SDR family oxidoreductase [Gammaproteobacteria bacterium]|nr:SDR family oxidoreductase [Gammaproteobacteria bacterium]